MVCQPLVCHEGSDDGGLQASVVELLVALTSQQVAVAQPHADAELPKLIVGGQPWPQ